MWTNVKLHLLSISNNNNLGQSSILSESRSAVNNRVLYCIRLELISDDNLLVHLKGLSLFL